MTGIIMAGGFGTRLRPLTYGLPKPMVPILNKPIMEYVVKLLAREGINDIVSLLYFEPEQIMNYFGNGENFGIKMRYTIPQADLGTCGAVKFAVNTYGINETVVVISGDVLTDFELAPAIEFHKTKRAAATILLTRVENPLSFGIVITASDGKIERFLEKPSWGQVFSDTINTGIYILEPDVFELVPQGVEFDFSKDLYPLMLKKDMGLYGYICSGYWRDIGSIKDYKEGALDALFGRVKLEHKANRVETEKAELFFENEPRIPDGVDFEGKVYLGKNVKIYSGAKIKDSVIGDNTIIEEKASCVLSILWDNARIGSHADIKEAIIASSAVIGENAVIMENAIISAGGKVGENAVVNPGMKVWPNKEVEAGAILTSSLIWGEKWSGELFTNARISGITNDEISPEFASKLGGVLGSQMGLGKAIAVSRDSDRASQMIARALISGLLAAGIKVSYFSILPIPTMRVMLRGSGEYSAGVHIRKSPYDARISDLIFFSADGKDMPLGLCRSIERLFFREDYARANYNQIGTLEHKQKIALDTYINAFLSSIDVELIKRRKFKVVVDFSFGGAIPVLQEIFDRLEIEIIPLNAFIDPNRITKTRDELEKQLVQLSVVVHSLRADIGFMIDPSGERLYIIDENGKLLTPDEELFAVIKLYLLVAGKKNIAVPISSTMAIDSLVAKFGGNLIRTRNDHLSLMEASEKDDIDFVAGTRGGFIFKPFSFACDAMYSTVKILELMAAKKDIRLSSLLDDFPKLVKLERLVPCSWKSKGKIMRELIQQTAGLKREIIDGVRILYDDGWVLILPDPARPQFFVLSESSSAEKATELADHYSELLRRWQEE